MACILTKSATDTRCALGRAPYDRQRDVYQLAQLGEKASIRLWNDFAAESPGQARVIIADVNLDKEAAVHAAKSVDKVLNKAEKKAKKDKHTVGGMAEQEKYLRSLLNSPDPSIREAAKRELGIA